MNKISIIAFLLCILFLPVSTAMAGNPFTSKQKQQHSAISPQGQSVFYVTIVMWQQKLRQKMADLIRSVQTTKRMAPVFFLMACSFAYGVIHSAGPGHGKAVALSYILSCKPGISKGLIFGNMVALTHGFSGILFVLTVKFLFQTQISGSLETVSHITQIISFSLICFLGLIIFAKSMYKWIKKPAPSQTQRFANPYITALAVGIIPCPGVVMVMLFAISLNLTWLGILLGIFISIGMATTISSIVVLGISGKSAVLSVTSNHKKRFATIEAAIETMAGLMITGLGLFFLLTLF
ncbi:MAG: hypothetical protein KKE44_10495 [Proteobacteria bacterium]|nr:hypothetical protein [Pseudomonadota bacterium]MBU1583153.1 hypothetical protein [Pseudomonadota bacterium]MBU2452930.1 hypothetical protein [Pseudomonadota bacterium]MBU2627520.1 hypothetical protein [Pseudomonadota bacterium]